MKAELNQRKLSLFKKVFCRLGSEHRNFLAPTFPYAKQNLDCLDRLLSDRGGLNSQVNNIEVVHTVRDIHDIMRFLSQGRCRKLQYFLV